MTTQEAWRRAWQQLDPAIVQGPLTARRTGRPSQATAKHLFPALFHGVLDRRLYHPRAVGQNLTDDALDPDLLCVRVLSCEPALRRLTCLVERLQRAYAEHRATRAAVHTPLDLLMPIARDLWQAGPGPTPESELRACLLAAWPATDAAWPEWPATSNTLRAALARPEVIELLETTLGEAWARAPAPAPHDHESQDDLALEVTRRWRSHEHAPGLDDAWAALARTAGTDEGWPHRHHLVVPVGPVAVPPITGRDHAHVLDRPVADRLRPGLQVAEPDELPCLGILLPREACRTAAPLGLELPHSRATLVAGLNLVVTLPTGDARETKEILARSREDADEAGGTGRPVRHTLVALLRRHHLARHGTPSADDPDDHRRTSQLVDLRRPIDLFDGLTDARTGPAVRLWPRLLGRELRDQPIADADAAYAVVVSAFTSWVKDRVTTRLSAPAPGTIPAGPAAPVDPTDMTDVFARLNRPDVRAEVLAALDASDEGDDDPFRTLWTRLVGDAPGPLTDWRDALQLLLDHRRDTP